MTSVGGRAMAVFPLPILHGERVRARGRGALRCWVCPSPHPSPRARGEGDTGSISPLASGVRGCCAMDPRDKPWDGIGSISAFNRHPRRGGDPRKPALGQQTTTLRTTNSSSPDAWMDPRLRGDDARGRCLTVSDKMKKPAAVVRCGPWKLFGASGRLLLSAQATPLRGAGRLRNLHR